MPNHSGCFVCGEGQEQPFLKSITLYSLVTVKGERSSVPRSIAVCKNCETVKEVDLRTTAGK